ncbi:hypothetical protein KK062_11300 [Fulvivirgaceae bacterium PWU5]|uniref:Uncharacterized protein n=1 Tax=Dawidia cretensis TaxID=2782350 RepID=A0AAP2DWD5_9BACT|nr:hypothetical protein [Dawidia cretensis]MBT1708815.1 hypothetical protein [Dawidia cretensis]
MGNRVLPIGAFLFVQVTYSLGQTGFEHYYYWKDKNETTFMPVIHFQNARDWYAEARYNYEEVNTFSLYVGKNFPREYKLVSYSLTPVVGVVVGELNGVSLGLLLAAEFRKYFFSSQSQCTLSRDDGDAHFLFSWTELGYAPVRWFYFGGSVQLTRFTHHGNTVADPGAFVGFETGNWSFPIYGFNLQNAGRYFILGINLTIERKKKDNL